MHQYLPKAQQYPVSLWSKGTPLLIVVFPFTYLSHFQILPWENSFLYLFSPLIFFLLLIVLSTNVSFICTFLSLLSSFPPFTYFIFFLFSPLLEFPFYIFFCTGFPFTDFTLYWFYNLLVSPCTYFHLYWFSLLWIFTYTGAILVCLYYLLYEIFVHWNNRNFKLTITWTPILTKTCGPEPWMQSLPPNKYFLPFLEYPCRTIPL